MCIAYLMFTLELFSKLDSLFMKSVYMFIQENYEGKEGLDKDANLLVSIKNAENKGEIKENILKKIDGNIEGWLDKTKQDLDSYIDWINYGVFK